MLNYLMTRTWISVAGLLVAVPVAAVTYVFIGHPIIFTCSGRVVVRQGANINSALHLVGYTSVATLVAVAALGRLARVNGRVLAVPLALEAIAITVAIGLVAADSATYIRYVPYYACDNSVAYTEVHHLAWLFAVWGVLLVLLALRAFGAWTGVQRLDPEELRERRRSNYSVPEA